MVYNDFQRSEKAPTQKEIPICYCLAIVFSFQEYQMCVCFFFLGLQRETDSSTNAGLEMDAISERNIQPLLGYDWIAGGLFE